MQKDTLLQTKYGTNELVEAFKANNEAVLKSIYKENYNKVLVYILQHAGTEQQAKDIYQEAFISLWENVKNGQLSATGSTSLNGYLFVTAKNRWIDLMRSEKNKKMVPTSKINGSAILHSAHETDEEYAEMDEKINKVMMAFNKIGKECKVLLTRVYFEKKSMKDIGAELNLDAASARNKKYRCMQKLRELANEK